MTGDVEGETGCDDLRQFSSQTANELSDEMQDVDIGISCRVAMRRRRLGCKGSQRACSISRFRALSRSTAFAFHA